MIPKSEKLAAEEKKDSEKPERSVPLSAATPLDDTIKVKVVEPLNDHVALLQFQTDVGGGIILPENEGYKDEGIVIGVGPGISDNAGGRLKPQVEVGDIVSFNKQHIVKQIKAESGVYKDRLILLISERSLIMKLPPRDFEIVDA